MTRYFRWQVGSRILGWPTLVPFVNDSKLIIEPSMHGATGNIYCGLYEFHDMAFLLHYLRPDEVFVDVGANVGTYTVLASAVVGATSVSIEPAADSFVLLQRNIRVNNIGHLVTATCCAAGKCDEIRQFTVARGPRSTFVGREHVGPAVEVPVKPLDALLEGQATALWKIDVEGSELEVLRGATHAIGSPSLRAVILEAHNNEIASFMQSYGFETSKYDPFTRELNTAGGRASTKNQLWLRDPSAVESRCQNGPSYRILSVTL
jgi:FkbM family methyltransferase